MDKQLTGRITQCLFQFNQKVRLSSLNNYQQSVMIRTIPRPVGYRKVVPHTLEHGEMHSVLMIKENRNCSYLELVNCWINWHFWSGPDLWANVRRHRLRQTFRHSADRKRYCRSRRRGNGGTLIIA